MAQRPSGVVVKVSPKGKRVKVGTVPGVFDDGEGGLLGLALKPGSKASKSKPVQLYAYLTTRTDNRIVRMSFDGAKLGKPKTVLTGIPSAWNHNGGAITFGPDGKLWIGTGDAAETENAQDKKSLGGKILRINPNGTVPADNPFKGSAVYSLGHRNVQGLAFDPAGRAWATEFGQDTWTSSTASCPAATTAGRWSRARRSARALSRRRCSGVPTSPPPAAWRS